MYGQVPVRMMPPVRTLTGLAGWGATAGFGLFWLIGDESFLWLKVRTRERERRYSHAVFSSVVFSTPLPTHPPFTIRMVS